MAQTNLLKPITQRLTSTPVQELPHIAYFLAASIASCSEILQSSQNGGGDDSAVLVYKLKTRISSLLQDRSQEGRFTAVILIKAILEAGGPVLLSTSEPWARGLIANLNKPDSTAIKVLYITTITRIFSLTTEHPSLHREITTALLPAFVNTCLNIIKPKVVKNEKSTTSIVSPVLETVLQSWLQLLPLNPSTFRPFVTRIQPICLHLISETITPRSLVTTASQLLAVLHLSAPKNSSQTQWTQTCRQVILKAHNLAGRIISSSKQDWQSSDPSFRYRAGEEDVGERQEGNLLGYKFQKWDSVQEGVHGIDVLLEVLENLISQPNFESCTVPLGQILDLSSRLTTIAAPWDGKTQQSATRVGSHVVKEEREEFSVYLPIVHARCLHLLGTLLRIFGSALLPCWRTILDQIISSFNTVRWDRAVLSATFDAVSILLPIAGPSMEKEDLKLCLPLIQACCQEIMRVSSMGRAQAPPDAHATKGKSNGNAIGNADSFLGLNKKKDSSNDVESRENGHSGSALHLLPLFLKFVPSHVIPPSLRAEIDRTSLVTRDQDAILASTLNPPAKQPGKAGTTSLIPFLARETGMSLGVEALLRPRMPVLGNFGEENESESIEDKTTTHTDLSDNNRKDNIPIDDPDIISDTGPLLSRRGPLDSLPSQHHTSISADSDHNYDHLGAITVAHKRGQDLISQEGQELDSIPLSDNTAGTVQEGPLKRPRIESAVLESESQLDDNVTMLDRQSNDNAMNSEEVRGFDEQESTPVTGSEVDEGSTRAEPLPYAAGRHHTLKNDDGTSDSEIPTIDIGPDTEDEDETD